MTTGSSGPTMAVENLGKVMGVSGMGMFDSAAWSRYLRQIQTSLPGLGIGAQSLTSSRVKTLPFFFHCSTVLSSARWAASTEERASDHTMPSRFHHSQEM